MITYEDAIALAKRLRAMSPAILGIELFGSVICNGQGRDADFLILVDNEVAKRLWTNEGQSLRVRWPEALHGQLWIIKKFIPFVYAAMVRGRRKERQKLAADMLGVKLEALANPSGEVLNFEMFLVPPNWRTEKEINMEVMLQVTDLINDQNTLGFLKRLARDAVNVI